MMAEKMVKKIMFSVQRHGCFVVFLLVLEKLLIWVLDGMDSIKCSIHALAQRKCASKRDDCSDLKKNIGLLEKYSNVSEAIVVATGPSSKSLTAAQAKGKLVIAVNEAYHFLCEQNIIPDFFVLNDDAYFTDDYKDVMEKGFVLLVKHCLW